MRATHQKEHKRIALMIESSYALKTGVKYKVVKKAPYSTSETTMQKQAMSSPCYTNKASQLEKLENSCQTIQIGFMEKRQETK